MSVFPLDVIADDWTGRQRGKVAKDGKAARWGGDGGGFTEDVSPVDGAVRSSRSSLLLLPLFIRVRKRHESQLRDEERRRTVDFFLFFYFSAVSPGPSVFVDRRKAFAAADPNANETSNNYNDNKTREQQQRTAMSDRILGRAY